MDFDEWIYKNYDRRVDLERIYNDTFNTDVEVNYDGSHLQLNDFNKNINLRIHQKMLFGGQFKNLVYYLIIKLEQVKHW